MSLTNTEKLLVEAITGALSTGEIGLSEYDPDIDGFSSQFSYMHENIEQRFIIAAGEHDLKYADAICTSFSRTHAHKYIDDPKFYIAYRQEMSSQGIPKEEQAIAHQIVNNIIADLSKNKDDWAEKDLGSGTSLNDISDLEVYNAE